MRLCFFIRDISIRHKTEEMLRIEHAAIQGCASGIVITSLEMDLEYGNPAFSRMIGVEEDALIGQDLRDILGDGMDELVSSALSDEQTWMAEMQIQDADQVPIHVQISVTACRNADGVPTGLVFSVADITARNNVPADEAVLAELQSLRAENDALQEELAVLRQGVDGS